MGQERHLGGRLRHVHGSRETGPAHKRIFTMGVYYGEKLIAKGLGPSKQEAELEAAKNALKKNK